MYKYAELWIGYTYKVLWEAAYSHATFKYLREYGAISPIDE